MIGQVPTTRKDVIAMPSDEAAKKKLLVELAEHFNVALVSLDSIAKQIATGGVAAAKTWRCARRLASLSQLLQCMLS